MKETPKRVNDDVTDHGGTVLTNWLERILRVDDVSSDALQLCELQFSRHENGREVWIEQTVRLSADEVKALLPIAQRWLDQEHEEFWF